MLSTAVINVVSLVLYGVNCSPATGIVMSSWRRNTTLNGFMLRTNTGVLWKTTAPSAATCVSLCAGCRACLHVMYNVISGHCQGDSEMMPYGKYRKPGNEYFILTGPDTAAFSLADSLNELTKNVKIIRHNVSNVNDMVSRLKNVSDMAKGFAVPIQKTMYRLLNTTVGLESLLNLLRKHLLSGERASVSEMVRWIEQEASAMNRHVSAAVDRVTEIRSGCGMRGHQPEPDILTLDRNGHVYAAVVHLLSKQDEFIDTCERFLDLMNSWIAKTS